MNKFFGSKLNTGLLLVLIVLMICALYLMFQNQELYLKPFLSPATSSNNTLNPAGGTMPALEGDSEDLVSFSVRSGQEVSGVIHATGTVKNNYFFEGNIGVAILDGNKKLLRQGHGTSTTDWMTAGPVNFNTTLDFTGLPQGLGYIELQKDDPSGLLQNAKSIYIPIVIN